MNTLAAGVRVIIQFAAVLPVLPVFAVDLVAAAPSAQIVDPRPAFVRGLDRHSRFPRGLEPYLRGAEGATTGYSGAGHAFLWDEGEMRDLGTLGGRSSIAYGLNDRGQVVGGSLLNTIGSHAFLWQGGVMTDLGTLGGVWSEAYGINKRGQVVGASTLGAVDPYSAPSHAFLWQDGEMIDLGTLGGSSSSASAINGRGQVVGTSERLETTEFGEMVTYQAFLWQDGTMTPLGTLGGRSSYAVGINERSQVTGFSDTAPDKNGYSDLRAFLWQDGVMTDLGTLGGTFSFPAGINDRGEVLGISDTEGGQFETFLWRRDRMTSLNSTPGPWAINNRGQLALGDNVGFPDSPCSQEQSSAYRWSGGDLLDLGSLGGRGSSPRAINDRGQIVGISETPTPPPVPPRDAPAHLWSNRFLWNGGAFRQEVTTDRGENVLLAGSFYGTIYFGGQPLVSNRGPSSGYLAKFGPDGTSIWSRSVGTLENVRALACDASGNVFVAGQEPFSDFGRVEKRDSGGVPLWSRSAQGAQFSDIAVGPDGGVVVFGTFSGTVDFGGPPLASIGESDLFLVRYGPDGSHLWSRRFGADTYERASGIALDPEGNILVTGVFQGDLDLGGGPMTSVPTGIYLAKLDVAGNHLWSTRLGQGQVTDIVVDGAGSPFLGFTSGAVLELLGYDPGYSLMVAKFDRDGRFEWSRGTECYPIDYPRLAADPDGGVAVLGNFSGTTVLVGEVFESAGREDVLLARFDARGEVLGSARYGNTEAEYGTAIAIDGGGKVVLGGVYSGSVDFGGGPLGAANEDLWLARFDPSGNALRQAGPTYRVHTPSPAIEGGPSPRLQAAGANPFRIAASLRYHLAKSGPVRLQVFSVSGKRVATLVDGMMPAGSHVATWDAKDRAPGVYFCRMVADGAQESLALVRLE